MTNTVAGVISQTVEAFGDAFDAVAGTAITAILVVIALGLAARWFSRKPKAG